MSDTKRLDVLPEEVKARLLDMSERDELVMLREAIQAANNVVLLTDPNLPDDPIIYVNDGFEKLTGYRRAEVLGRTPRILQGPKTDRAVLRRMRRRLKVGRPFQGETFNYRKDGTPYVLAWHIAPIRDAQENITHWVSTQRDVTERRALERETLDISAREQRRIAADLHDSVQQHLIGTAMQAKALARSLAAGNHDHAAEAEGLYALVLEGVTGLRTVVQGIMPVQASENGLMLALDGLSVKVRDLYGVPCTFSYETPVHFSNFELATQLYYIAQEAAVNAAKHASASHIEIGLERKGGHALLSIRDDGRGFTYRADETPSSGGMGLRLMAYRARLVGARLEVASQPGGGTTVTCTFEPK